MPTSPLINKLHETLIQVPDQTSPALWRLPGLSQKNKLSHHLHSQSSLQIVYVHSPHTHIVYCSRLWVPHGEKRQLIFHLLICPLCLNWALNFVLMNDHMFLMLLSYAIDTRIVFQKRMFYWTMFFNIKQNKIQVALERHGFELCGSTYMWIFFNK